MDKHKMLQVLEEREPAYRSNRPVTAELDLHIFRAYCAGKTAVQISMDVPCSESTVYRSIRRVKEFLETPELAPFKDVLKRVIQDFAPNLGTWDAQSVLDMLFVSYADYNRISPEESGEDFHELRLLLDKCPDLDSNSVFDIVCDLCNSHMRSGFIHGVRLGASLADELNN